MGYWIGHQCTGTETIIDCLRCESSQFGLVMGQDQYGAANFCTGAAITGFQTERDFIAVRIINASLSSLRNMILTGTLGPGYPGITNIVGNGTTATVTVDATHTLNSVGWTGGTRPITIENSGGPYDMGNVWATGTWISPTQFSYPTTATGAMGTGFTVWSVKQFSALQIFGANNCTLEGITSNIAASNIDVADGGAGFDLWAGGGHGSNNVTMICCGAGGSWNAPDTPFNKASYQFINCDNPVGSTLDVRGVVSGMHFRDLPGQTSVSQAGPLMGQTYDILDATVNTFGAAVTVGGGTNAVRVRYNGTNWTVAGV
jgi:hypothetical protein